MQPEPLPADIAARFAGFQPFAWGNTGTLFLGAHPESGQMVLLKLLSMAQTSEPAERSRHHRELRKQLGIAYPHLPRVLEEGESGGRVWFVREFVSGESLLLRLRLRGAHSTPAALSVIAQLASSLDALHRNGLVHRDLKPGHVLFRSDSTGAEMVQLIDAGIAMSLPGRTGPDARGTPAYAAPELLELPVRTQASFRTDLYALGCLASELLTGSQPFARASLEETLVAQRMQAPPELDAAVPAAVRTLIASLLSKDPRRRPFSAQQVRRSLEPFLPDTVPPAPALPRSSPPPPPPEALGAAERPSAAQSGGYAPQARSAPPPSAAVSGDNSAQAAPATGTGKHRAPPLGAAGPLSPKRSTPPPPPPEALGMAGLGGTKRSVPAAPGAQAPAAAGQGSARPQASAARSAPPGAAAEVSARSGLGGAASGSAAADGGGSAPRSAPPPGRSTPDPTLELRTDELEPASVAIPVVAVGAPLAASSTSVPPSGTQELDLDELGDLLEPGPSTARTAQQVTSRVPTQRPGLLAAPAARSPSAEDSAPTIAIDPSMRPASDAPPVDELGQAAKRESSTPSAASAGPSLRSRMATKLGMGPVKLPPGTPSERPEPARARTGTVMGQGPAQVAIPRGAPSAAVVAESAAIAGGTAPAAHGGVAAAAGAAAQSGAREKSSASVAAPGAGRSAFEPVRDAEASLGKVDLMDPHADQERVLRAARRPPLSQRPNVLLWGAAALALLALGLRLVRGRGPERAESSVVEVRVPEAEPVAQLPPAAEPPADVTASQPTAAEARPSPSVAQADPPPPSAATPQPAAAEPSGPVAPPSAAALPAASDAPAPAAAASPVQPVATLPAAKAGKGFLRESGAGGVVSYRSRPQLAPAEEDWKTRARQLFQEGKFRDAADAYQRAGQRSPSDAAAFAGLGASWLAAGEAERAVSAYQKAVQLKPEVSGFQAALGRAYLSKGDRVRALAAYNKALELDPDNQAARSGAAALQGK